MRRRMWATTVAAAMMAPGIYLASGGTAQALPPCSGPDPAPICEPTPRPPRPPLAPARPDLQTQVTATPATVTQNGTATVTATVTNPTSATTAYRSAPASGVEVDLTGPSGAVATSVSATGGLSCTRSAAQVSCTGGSIVVGGAVTVTVTLTMQTPVGQQTTTAVADPRGVIAERDETNNSAGAATNVTGGPDLTVSMTGPGSVQGVYAVGTWKMTVTNLGTSTANNVRLNWLAPWGGWVNANYVGGGFQCWVPAEYVLQTVNCLMPTLAAVQSATVTLNIVPPAPGSVGTGNGASTETATVDPYNEIAETNENNNVARTSTTVW